MADLNPVYARKKYRAMGGPGSFITSGAAVQAFRYSSMLERDLLRGIHPGTHGEVTEAHVDAAVVRVLRMRTG